MQQIFFILIGSADFDRCSFIVTVLIESKFLAFCSLFVLNLLTPRIGFWLALLETNWNFVRSYFVKRAVDGNRSEITQKRPFSLSK
jgi:hypothetical protein